MRMKRSDDDSHIGENAVFKRPGYGDPRERLRDMDQDGVEVEVLYSEVSAFRYIPDLKTGADEATRAFNDALDEFASVDRQRLCVSYQIPIHDIDFAVSEVERIAGRGGRSLQLPVFPAEFGLPDYYDDRYDRLFSAIEDTGLPVCCHIGLNTSLDGLSRRDPTPQKGVMVLMTPLSTAEAFGMWILTGLLARHPKLKLVFVEPGLAWVAWWLHSADDMVRRQGYEFPGLTELPSHYFQKNVHLTFIEEDFSLEFLRHKIRSAQHHVVVRLSASGDVMAQISGGRGEAVPLHSAGRAGADSVRQCDPGLEYVELGRCSAPRSSKGN